MKALVTGASGFIGSHLVETLLAENIDVRCLVRSTSNLAWLLGKDVEFVSADCRDLDSVCEAVRDVDLVFHLAGVVRARDLDEYFQVNCLGARNLIQACLRVNPELKRFVFMSSQAVGGPSPDQHPLIESDTPVPISAYGWSKLLAEKEVLAEAERLPVVVLRPSPVYGPRDKNFFSLFKMIHLGLRPVLGEQQRFLHLIYVKDLVEGCLQAAGVPEACGKIYFLAEDRRFSWEDIGRIISTASARQTRQFRIPVSLSRTISGLAELWAGLVGKAALVNRDKVREMLARFWLCDTSRAKQELEFKIRFPLEIGAREAYRWYRRQGWL